MTVGITARQKITLMAQYRVRTFLQDFPHVPVHTLKIPWFIQVSKFPSYNICVYFSLFHVP
jgi:hypothetical protein